MRLSSVFLLALIPCVCGAQVSINEISWMGTSVSSNDEWVELYNNSSSNVDLSDWTLEWSLESSSPKIVELDGSLAAGGYYLLERTDDSTVPGVLADLIYTGALSNIGKKLYLRSPAGTVQTLDFLTGWPAGDNGTKDTMQWTGSIAYAKQTPDIFSIIRG